MTYQSEKNLQTIEQTNLSLLEYFHGERLEILEKLQQVKTDLFEINVRIEELEKTRELYLFKHDDRRNLFMPIPVEVSGENQKGKVIDQKLHELNEKKFKLATTQSNLESDLSGMNAKIQAINDSIIAIHDIKKEDSDETDSSARRQAELEYIEEKGAPAVDENALYILMHQAYDKKRIVSILDQQVTTPLTASRSQISTFLTNLSQNSSLSKAALETLLNDLATSMGKSLNGVAYIKNHYHLSFDGKLPAWEVVDSAYQQLKNKYPEVLIEGKTDCYDLSLRVHPMYTMFLINTLNEIVANAVNHGKSNKVLIKVNFETHKISMMVSDNGIGITKDAYDKSKWFSGLHNINDNLQMLNGNLEFRGSLSEGTTIKLYFPI